jgi:hypothetical protein
VRQRHGFLDKDVLAGFKAFDCIDRLHRGSV